MKMNTEPTFVHTDGVGEVKRATIKASSKIFDFFSKQIYSDCFTAIWRELVANGIDAQKVNGVTRPPVITVPSVLEPMAKVRDFGTGMGHEFMMNKFMAFTDASTKENSNDFIGGFGIGSKAPLSYTDQYSIKCFQNGEVRVYSVFKDDEGCPSIAFLSKDSTTEPDGVEVAFPVRQDDIGKFVETVERTLQYFDPLPVLENTDLKLEPVQYDAKGDRWGIRVKNIDRKSKVIVGGVAYPLDVSQIPYSENSIRTYANLGVDIYLDIGDVNIALSREHITHDQALFDKLKSIIQNMGVEFGKQMSKAFADCKTAWEAKLMLDNAIEGVDYHTQQMLRKHAVWQGKELDVYIKKPAGLEVLIVCQGRFDYTSGLSSIIPSQALSPKFRIWADHAYFKANTFDVIVIDDVDSTDKPALRIRTLLQHYANKKVLIIRDNSEKHDLDMKKVLADIGGPPASIVDYVSKYAPFKITRTPGAASTPKTFKCYPRTSKPYRGATPSDVLPTGGGMYVVMDNWYCDISNEKLEAAQLAKPANTVWLNQTDFKASGLEKNPAWFSVDEMIEKAKAQYRSQHKSLSMAEAVYRWQSREPLVQAFEELRKCDKFPKRGPLAELFRLYSEFKDVSDRSHSHIRVTLLDVKWEKDYDKLKDLAKQVRAKYPHIAEIIADSYLIRRCSTNLINALF